VSTEGQRQATASEVLRLRAESDLNNKEIGQRLGISAVKVGSIQNKAKMSIRHTKVSQWLNCLLGARAEGVSFEGMEVMIYDLTNIREYCAMRGSRNLGETDMEELDREAALEKAAQGLTAYQQTIKKITMDLNTATARAANFRHIVENF